MVDNKQILTSACGHHCGVLTTGSATHVGHCPCPECHNNSETERDTHVRRTERPAG